MSIAAMVVCFVDLGGHNLFHVCQVAFGVTAGAVVPLSVTHFVILFGHYINLMAAHPQPCDTFVVTFDAFLLPSKLASRPFFTEPPRDEPLRLRCPSDVQCCFRHSG